MLPSIDRRPWPAHPRYLVGEDGSIVGPRGPLRGSRSREGYLLISYRKPDGRRSCTSANFIVCETFHGPRPDGMEAAHYNGVRDDNRAENLRWATRAGNMADRRRHGTNGVRLTREQVSAIRAEPDIERAELARRYGVTPGTISHVRTGRTWPE